MCVSLIPIYHANNRNHMHTFFSLFSAKIATFSLPSIFALLLKGLRAALAVNL